MAGSLATFFQIALVVVLGAPEGLCGLDLSDNGVRFETIFGEKLDDFGLSLGLLVGGVKEDGGAVLGAVVGTLAIEGGGVVQNEESVEELLVADQGGIEVKFDNLGVAGLVGADILIGRALKRAALVSNSGGDDAGNGCESGFDSPEAAGAEGGFLCAHIE